MGHGWALSDQSNGKTSEFHVRAQSRKSTYWLTVVGRTSGEEKLLHNQLTNPVNGYNILWNRWHGPYIPRFVFAENNSEFLKQT